MESQKVQRVSNLKTCMNLICQVREPTASHVSIRLTPLHVSINPIKCNVVPHLKGLNNCSYPTCLCRWCSACKNETNANIFTEDQSKNNKYPSLIRSAVTFVLASTWPNHSLSSWHRKRYLRSTGGKWRQAQTVSVPLPLVWYYDQIFLHVVTQDVQLFFKAYWGDSNGAPLRYRSQMAYT